MTIRLTLHRPLHIKLVEFSVQTAPILRHRSGFCWSRKLGFSFNHTVFSCPSPIRARLVKQRRASSLFPSNTRGSMTEILPENTEFSEEQREELREIDSSEQYPLHDRDLPIHKAAYRGDNAQVTSLVASGVNVNARSINEYTPLQLAIRGDHAETIRILLSAGADPTLLDEFESWAMRSFDAINGAARLGAHHALGALMERGVKTPASALCWAASLNHVDAVHTILEKLGQDGFSDMPRLEGLSAALDRAALCGHLEAFELVLVHVKKLLADSVPEDRSCLSAALVSAARPFECEDRCRKAANQLPIMQKLVTAGADVNHEHAELGLNAFWACLDGPIIPKDVVLLLLQNGLQLSKTFTNGRTPLFGIIVNSDDEASLVEAFLEAGAKAEAKDGNLDTPLHLATHASFADLLLKHGADLSAKNSGGKTPLHTACEASHVGVVEFLLSKGDMINEAETEKRWTPLLLATNPERRNKWMSSPEQYDQLIKLLLEHGANVQATASDGRTVLHNTARNGDANLVKVMIEQGADICAVTSDGETALHSVCNFSHDADPKIAQRLSIINMLLDQGANINARDQTGSTPLHTSWPHSQFVSLQFTPDLFNLLVEKGADRFAKDVQMRTPFDLIDTKKWMWDEDGSVREKPKPVHERVYNPSIRGRGQRWTTSSSMRGRGRGR